MGVPLVVFGLQLLEFYYLCAIVVPGNYALPPIGKPVSFSFIVQRL